MGLAAFFFDRRFNPRSFQGMALPGSASAGNSGAATYNIPIVVPPGTAGMTPSIGLSYNSQGGNNTIAGNGIVGMGWSFDGCRGSSAAAAVWRRTASMAGSITTPMTASAWTASDWWRSAGPTAPMARNIAPRSRLSPRSSRTARPGWDRPGSKCAPNPAKSWSSATHDSRILAQGKTVARSWAVNKVVGQQVNYFTVTYVNDTANGQAYPSRIDYTGNTAASSATYNSVQFVYNTARPDITPAYHQGSLIQTRCC